MRLVVALGLALFLSVGRVDAGPKPATARKPAAASYTCPMHCEGAKTYGTARSCPVCGMALSEVGGARYRVDVLPARPLEAGVENTLAITIRDPDGDPVRRLEVVHEKLVHLLIVSSDLSWFAHEHPEREADGRFTLRTTFPAPGTYTLFHDFTPPRVGMQVVPVELTVAGTPPPSIALVPDDAQPKRVDGLTARLTPSAPLVAETNLALTVSFARDDQPVTDLEPFLGAMGHLIIVSADRGRFVHSHPVERPGARPARGPDVRFQCQFPAPGLYKAWAQVQRAGRVVTVPFTLDVRG